MLDKIITKIRALIEDAAQSDFELFEYTDFAFFPLCEDVISVTSVLKNGVELSSGDYNFDTTTNKLEVTASLTSGDKIEVRYTYYKYSEAELKRFVNNACIWISVNKYRDFDFDLDNEDFFTTPTNDECDLIALVASVLIKPNYQKYSLPNKSVTYPRRTTKEEKIRKIINNFKSSLGIFDTIDLDNY